MAGAVVIESRPEGSRLHVGEGVVAHHRFRRLHPEGGEVLDRPPEHRSRGGAALVGVLLDVGVAGVVVDHAVQVDIAPERSLLGAGLGANPGDSVAGALEAGEASDVDVGPGRKVAVVGDGAVGLCGVIAAKRLGAEQIVILGRHEERTDLAREFGATDVVAERGAEAVERVRELTDGFGAHSVLECVGLDQSTQTAIEIARPGGAIGRVGVPQSEPMPGGQASFYGNIRIGGGPAPVRAYIEELLPDILDGTIEPGRVFDRTVDLDGVPDGYRAMDEREALKVMVEP